jgi:quercetin dioxygenase-like cupin family protein
MIVFRHANTAMAPADESSFVGTARAKLLASAGEVAPVRVYRVEFESGSRTNWHRHSGPQWLLIVEGRVRVQRWQAAAEDVEAGDAVLFEPGEKHWHGASPGARGVHLALNINVKTEWLEPVTDADYAGPDHGRGLGTGDG